MGLFLLASQSSGLLPRTGHTRTGPQCCRQERLSGPTHCRFHQKHKNKSPPNSKKGVNPYFSSFFIHIPTELWLDSVRLNSFIALCKRAFAVLDVPRGGQRACSYSKSGRNFRHRLCWSG